MCVCGGGGGGLSAGHMGGCRTGGEEARLPLVAYVQVEFNEVADGDGWWAAAMQLLAASSCALIMPQPACSVVLRGGSKQ